MRQKRALGIMTALLLLAAFLRFYQLDTQSFWNDEGNSARLSERTVPLIIEGTASDIHPPLYYLLLKGWRIGSGSSEFGLRSFSVYLGIALVAVTYTLGRKLLGQESLWVSIAAAALVAINPALVYYSQEARMYELLAFLAVTSCMLLLRLLDSRRRQIIAAAAYVLVMAAGFYTHYFFPTVLIIQLVLVIIWLRGGQKPIKDNRPQLIVIGTSLILAFILYLPWLPIFLRQSGGRAADRARIYEFLLDSWRWLGFGGFVTADDGKWGVIILTILILIGVAYAIRRSKRKASYGLVIVAGAGAPIAMMVLVGTTQPVFYKFILMAIPWLTLLAALGFAAIWRLLKTPFRYPIILSIILLLAAGIVWSTGRALRKMYFDPTFARADYRGIVDRIKKDDHPDAAIILNAANQWEVFTYYYDESAYGASTVLPIPRGNPKPEFIYEELEEVISNNHRIYALFWGEAERDPERLVERWLDENAFKANDEWVGDVRFVTYAVEPGSIFENDEELNLIFGDQIQLQSVSLGPRELFPGEILPITFRWLAETELKKRYKVFLHLVDESGQIAAQRDSEPGGGRAITSTWIPGEIIEDNYGILLPDELSPGVYSLLIGLYDIADPANRLIIQSDLGELDAFPLATITIKSSSGSEDA